MRSSSSMTIMQSRRLSSSRCLINALPKPFIRSSFIAIIPPMASIPRLQIKLFHCVRLHASMPNLVSTTSFVSVNNLVNSHTPSSTTTGTFDNVAIPCTTTNLKPFLLADIGEGIAEVEIIQWYVLPGDSIRQFDKVCEVQSDKATVDITSRFDGIVDQLCGQKGDVIQVGNPLLFIREDETMQKEESQASRIPSILDPLHNVDREADQLQIPSIHSMQTDSLDESHTAISVLNMQDIESPSGQKVLTSPAVRKLGKENGLNLTHVIGTGPQGRIMKSDVLRHIQEKTDQKMTSHMTQATATAAVTTMSEQPTTPTTASSHDQVIPVRGYHRLMASAMQAALQVPHMCYGDEVNVTELKKFREELNSTLEDMRNIKLSYLPFAIKACSLAMKEFPIINASIDIEEMVMIFHTDHDIGIAMDSPRGLVVPVIPKCQDKSILDIATALKRLQEKALDSSLSEEELTTPTFSISNIGALGGTYMNPVVLPPQVAIGALGKIQRIPRFIGTTNQVEESYILNISWGGDHRALDGATLARFSNVWKGYMEKPSRMMIALR